MFSQKNSLMLIISLFECQYVFRENAGTYGTRAVTTLGLYIFTPLFTAVYIVERLIFHDLFFIYAPHPPTN